MQYRLEEVGSEQRFIDNASPLRARKNPFICSRGSSQVLHEKNDRCNTKEYSDCF
jgi:hypothetical protein